MTPAQRRQVRAEINRGVRRSAEHKYNDEIIIYSSASATFPFDTVGALTSLTATTQAVGDAASRIGDSVSGTSLEYRIMVYAPDVPAQSSGFFFRTTIFIYRDNDGLHVPTINDIYQINTAVVNLISPFDHDRKIARKILYDKTVMLFDHDNTRMSENNYVCTEVINLASLKRDLKDIRYVGSAPTGTNNIYLLVTTNINNAAQAAAWVMNIYTRYNYVDI